MKAELVISHEWDFREKSEQFEYAIQQSTERLAAVFDRIPADTLVEIDSLFVEISLKNEDFSQIGDKLTRVLLEKCERILQPDFRVEKMDEFITGKGETEPENRRKELILHFLKTGLLPWWGGKAEFQDSVQWIKNLQAKQLMEILKPHIRNNPMILQRMANQLPPEVIENIIETLAADHFVSGRISTFLNKILRFAKEETTSEILYRQLRSNIYLNTLHTLFTNTDKKSVMAGIAAFTVGSLGENDEKKQRIITKLEQRFQKPNKLKTDWEKDIKPLIRSDLSEVEIYKDELTVKSGRKISELKDSITVFNAGVVLLHSFLAALFKNLGTVENGEFVSKSAKERAVCAVHYLATGSDDFPEHELLVAKFLCGWPLDEPVNRFLPFSDYEKEECDNLLLSIIQHWSALKNTSVDGLRKSFLQREGILKKEEFGWNLYIENLTYDVLLQKLPWGFSVIKLKWMEEMLYVKWE